MVVGGCRSVLRVLWDCLGVFWSALALLWDCLGFCEKNKNKGEKKCNNDYRIEKKERQQKAKAALGISQSILG